MTLKFPQMKSSAWLLALSVAACDADLVGGKGPEKALSPVPDIPSIEDDPIDDRDPTGAGGTAAAGTGGSSAGSGGHDNVGDGDGDSGDGGSDDGSGGSSTASGGAATMGGAPNLGGMGGETPLGGSRN